MKKTVLILLCMLLSTGLFALSYSPDLTISSGGTFSYFASNIDSAKTFRPQINAGFSINPIAFTTNDDIRISLPFSVEYTSKSNVIDRLFIQPRLRYEMDLRVDLFLSKHFSLFFSPGVGLTHYYKANGYNLYLSFETGPEVFLGNYVSLSIPAKAIASPGSIEFEVKAAFTVYPFKIKEVKK